MLLALLQVVEDAESTGFWQKVYDFFDTPAPYSPFTEYVALLLLLWLLAERGRRRKTFEKQAQDVLEEKLAAGEINKTTFDKYRQDVTLRPKR